MTLKVGLLTPRQILINLTKTQLRHDIDTEGAHQVGDWFADDWHQPQKRFWAPTSGLNSAQNIAIAKSAVALSGRANRAHQCLL
jgi:hypothetical protein